MMRRLARVAIGSLAAALVSAGVVILLAGPDSRLRRRLGQRLDRARRAARQAMDESEARLWCEAGLPAVGKPGPQG
jgi:hypothetical protein